MRLVVQPSLQIRPEPIIGGDHLEDLPGTQALQCLSGFADRHGTDQPVTVENLVRSQTFQIGAPPRASRAARMLACSANPRATSVKARPAGESGCVRTTG